MYAALKLKKTTYLRRRVESMELVNKTLSVPNTDL